MDTGRGTKTMNKFRITTNGGEFRVEMLEEEDCGPNGIIRRWLRCGTGKYFTTLKEAEKAKDKIEKKDRRRNGDWVPVNKCRRQK